MRVFQRLALAHDQHAGGVARLGGMERDAVGGKVEVEVVDAHQGPVQLTGQAP